MNFVAMEPCFYSNSSLLWIWFYVVCLSNKIAMATFTRFLLKIIKNLIDKICDYVSRMDDPSLNDSDNYDF